MKSYHYGHKNESGVNNMEKAKEEYGKVCRIKKWYRTPAIAAGIIVAIITVIMLFWLIGAPREHADIPGEINQLGFVVTNMDAAMRKYGELYMVEQWYRPVTGEQDVIYYHGEEISDEGMDLIVGYYGDMEIELIKPANEPNVYSAYIEQYGEGFHHICYHVKDLNAALDYYRALGFEVVQNGSLVSNLSRTNYAYIARPEEGLTRILELSETVLFGKIHTIRSKNTIMMGIRLGVVDVIPNEN